MSRSSELADFGSSSVIAPIRFIEKKTADGTGDNLVFTSINSLTQYRNIMFHMNNIFPASNSDTISLVVATSGTSYDTSNNYLSINTRSFYDGTTTGGNLGHFSSKAALMSIGGIGNQATDGNINEADGGISGKITLYGAPHDVEYHNCHFETTNGASDGFIIHSVGSGKYHLNSSPITAVRFKFSSGNIASGSIAMYGIKDS